jgi:hypothetical protein
MRFGFAAGFLAVCSVSCAVVPGDGEEDAGETTMKGDGDSTGDGDGDSGDGDGEPGDGDPGDGDGDVDPDCPPADPDVYFSYEPFDFGVDPWDVDIDWTCTVTQSDSSEGLYVVLDCPDADIPIAIDVSATPSFHAPVYVDDVVQVRYVYEGPFWFNVYLRLDIVDYGHLLTLIDGDSLLPPDNYEFEPMLDMESISGLCTPEPDFCGDAERLAVGFTVFGEILEMPDRSYGTVDVIAPAPHIWVSSAVHLHDITCTDTPDEWFRVLIASSVPE